MLALLLLALAGPLPPAVGALLLGRHRRAPVLLWWAVPSALVLVGAVGRIQGHDLAREAVAQAPLETRNSLLHAGIAVAAYPGWAGWGLAALLLAGSAVLAGLGLAVGAGDGARFQLVRAGLVLLAGLFGAVLVAETGQPDALWVHSGLESWGLTALVMIGGVALALAAVRDRAEPADGGRLARGRVLVASLVLGSLLCLAAASYHGGDMLIHEAIARASAETRAALVAAGLATQRAWLLPVQIGIVVTGVVGVWLCLGALRHLTNSRSLVSGGLGAALLVLPLGVSGFASLQAAWLEEQTREMRLSRLLEQVGGLPKVQHLGAVEVERRQLHRITQAAVWDGEDWRLEGHDIPGTEPLTLPLEPVSGEFLLLVAPGDLSARELVSPRTRWATGDGGPQGIGLLLVVEQGESRPTPDSAWLVEARVGTLPIEWVPPRVLAERTAAREIPGTIGRLLQFHYPNLPGVWDSWEELLFIEGRADGLALHTHSDTLTKVNDLAAVVPGVLDLELQIAGGAVFIVSGADWTVQDVVSHCLAARSAVADSASETQERSAVSCAITDLVPAAVGASRRRLPQRLAIGGQELVVSGALDRFVLQEMLQRHLNHFRHCYSRVLQSPGAGQEGELTVRFEVDVDGTVSSAKVQSSALKNPELERCVVRHFQSIQFPTQEEGEQIIVAVPIVFSPS